MLDRIGNQFTFFGYRQFFHDPCLIGVDGFDDQAELLADFFQ